MMIALLLLLVPLALATPTDYIVGGSNVDIANYPWQGSYRPASGSHSCGCVFVGGVWVITAGHCGGSASYSMEFGSSNRNSGSVFGVSSVTVHPNYDSGPGFTQNDISVVQAQSTISGTNISPGTMAASTANPGGNGMITGWGRTCGSCNIPVALQGTSIPIISDASCTSIWGSSFQASAMICVWGGTGGTIGSCNGDSGGPMSVGSTIYGVTSWGVSGCGTNYPSVYTRVAAYKTWVCSTAGNGPTGC